MRYKLLVYAVLGAAPLLAQPSVNPGGVVNVASYSPAGLANSSIAQGSLFIVFGSNLGPATLVSGSFPLQTTLAGTSASVAVNGTMVSPPIIYTAAGYVAMLMPSSTPTGKGTITMTYNGKPSQPEPVTVVGASFGIFTVNQGGSGPAVISDTNYAVISLVHAANPGQTLVLWGTGLGPISADETQPAPIGNVGEAPTVWVGTQRANVSYWGRSSCCSGLDQINFQVPAGVTGCFVPVAVQIGATVSNYASIAVASAGSTCSDPGGLRPAQLSLVGNGSALGVATLSLSRSTVTRGIPPAQLPTTTTTDSGSASFVRYSPSQLLSSTFGQAVSLGGCMVFAIEKGAAVNDPVQPTGLDAGSVVEVGGINGTIDLKPQGKGYYGATLGSGAAGTLFLDVPAHTINVFGGADVGVFAQEVRMPPALTWANQGAISTVSESQGVTVSWTDAVPNGYVTISGYSLAVDQSGAFGSGESFFCIANAGAGGAGQFVVPPAVLLNLPTQSASASAVPSAFLGIATSQTPSDPFTPVRGIDVAFISTSVQVMKSVTYAP